MKTRDRAKYIAASEPMGAAEFRDIQGRYGLSNSDISGMLRCSTSAVEAYRSEKSWARPIPAAVAGFLRLMDIHQSGVENRRKHVKDCITRPPIYKNSNRGFPLQPPHPDPKKQRAREYARAYQTFRRTGNSRLLDKFYSKYGSHSRSVNP